MMLVWRRDGTWVANKEVSQGNRDMEEKFMRICTKS